MDILVPISMKNAAKCDKQCELQNSANHQIFERKLRRAVRCSACLFQCRNNNIYLNVIDVILMCDISHEIRNVYVLIHNEVVTYIIYMCDLIADLLVFIYT